MRKPDQRAIAVEYVALQWQFRCTRVHSDGDPFMAEAEVRGGTVYCLKCGTSERIAEMDLRWRIFEDGKVETRVTPAKFDHFSR